MSIKTSLIIIAVVLVVGLVAFFVLKRLFFKRILTRVGNMNTHKSSRLARLKQRANNKLARMNTLKAQKNAYKQQKLALRENYKQQKQQRKLDRINEHKKMYEDKYAAKMNKLQMNDNDNNYNYVDE